MREQDWTYLGQLVRSLYLEGVDGARIGEHVAEIDAHLAESGVDPVEEFGPPAKLASELAARPGSRRPGWVPPLWSVHLVGLAFLLVVSPLLAPYLWGTSTIPVTGDALAYGLVFYGGVSWIVYGANRRLDGRSWKALAGIRSAISILVLAVVVTWVSSTLGDRVLFEVSKIPYLVFAATMLPVLFVVLLRRSNPVRFPAHAQHLNRLRRGPFSGQPPQFGAR